MRTTSFTAWVTTSFCLLAFLLLCAGSFVGCDRSDPRYGSCGIYLGMSQREVLKLASLQPGFSLDSNGHFTIGPDGVARPSLKGFFIPANVEPSKKGVVSWEHAPESFGGRVMEITWGWGTSSEQEAKQFIDELVQKFGQPRLNGSPKQQPEPVSIAPNSDVVLATHGWGGVKMLGSDVIRDIRSDELAVLLTVKSNTLQGGKIFNVLFSDNVALRKSTATIRGGGGQ